MLSAECDAADRDVQEKVANYCILRVMIDQSNTRLFAIAKTSTNERLLLVEMKVPDPGGGISLTKISRIPGLSYGDDFTERLVEAGKESFVLLTTLARGKRIRGSIIKMTLP